MFEYGRLTIEDEKVLDASIKHFNKYEMFYLSMALDLGRDDLFGDKKAPFIYSIENIRFFLLDNDFVKMLGKDTVSPIELTDRGRKLREVGSIDAYIKWDEQQKEKEQNREDLGDIILGHHANIITWERRYKKLLQIATIVISLGALWVSWMSYRRDEANSRQQAQSQEQLKKLEMQLRQLEETSGQQ